MIGLTYSYRTISLDAVHVLAGELPIDLETERRNVNYGLRKGNEYKLGDGTYLVETKDEEGQSRAKKNAKNFLLDEWQGRWTRSTKGRKVYALPSVRERLKITWMEPNFYISQIIFGRGNFAAKLTMVTLKDNPNCECGDLEDNDHLMFECNLFDDEKENLKRSCLDKGVLSPADKQKLLTKEIFPETREAAMRILKKNEEMSG